MSNGDTALPSPASVPDQLTTLIKLTQKAQEEKNDKSSERSIQLKHGSLMVAAVLAAGATYQAGLSPPGGLWQADDNQGHAAGMPILRDTFSRRYKAFFYCNSVSFITSLVLIILLMNKGFGTNTKIMKVLEVTVVLDMFGFMGAYAAGSCRELTDSVVLFLLMGGVFIQVIITAAIYSNIDLFAKCAAFKTTLKDCLCP